MCVYTCVLGFSVGTWVKTCDASGGQVGSQSGCSSCKRRQPGADGVRGSWELSTLIRACGLGGEQGRGPADPSPLRRFLHPLSTGGCPLDEALHHHP